MDIILSNSSVKPIYEQITDQVKEQIMAGTLSAGDALPSMRLLAKGAPYLRHHHQAGLRGAGTRWLFGERPRQGLLRGTPKPGAAAGVPQLRRVEEKLTQAVEEARREPSL